MSRISHRFNANREWLSEGQSNHHFYGILDLLIYLRNSIPTNSKMIEIGSYMGESTMLFCSTHLFQEVNVIEPHKGHEHFNHIAGITWDDVIQEFNHNTNKFSDIIKLHKGYSYEFSDNFNDNEYDFIYIDGSHFKEDVERDLRLYLPKLRKGGFISGHDYHEVWPGLVDAVNNIVGTPDVIFEDSSWIKRI